MEADQTNGKAAETSAPVAAEKKIPVKEISDEHIQALLAGKVVLCSETSKYLVKRARETSVNGKHVQERLQFARTMIEQLEVEGQRLAGQMEGYIHDIKHWEAKAIVDTMVPSPAKDEPQAS